MVAVFTGLMLVGAASATLIDSFGVIKGTASVDSALEMTSVSPGSNEVVIGNNMEGTFDSSQNSYDILVNGTEQDISQENIASGESVTYGVTFYEGATVALQINGNVVDSEVNVG